MLGSIHNGSQKAALYWSFVVAPDEGGAAEVDSITEKLLNQNNSEYEVVLKDLRRALCNGTPPETSACDVTDQQLKIVLEYTALASGLTEANAYARATEGLQVALERLASLNDEEAETIEAFVYLDLVAKFAFLGTQLNSMDQNDEETETGCLASHVWCLTGESTDQNNAALDCIKSMGPAFFAFIACQAQFSKVWLVRKWITEDVNNSSQIVETLCPIYTDAKATFYHVSQKLFRQVVASLATLAGSLFIPYGLHCAAAHAYFQALWVAREALTLPAIQSKKDESTNLGPHVMDCIRNLECKLIEFVLVLGSQGESPDESSWSTNLLPSLKTIQRHGSDGKFRNAFVHWIDSLNSLDVLSFDFSGTQLNSLDAITRRSPAHQEACDLLKRTMRPLLEAADSSPSPFGISSIERAKGAAVIAKYFFKRVIEHEPLEKSLMLQFRTMRMTSKVLRQTSHLAISHQDAFDALDAAHQFQRRFFNRVKTLSQEKSTTGIREVLRYCHFALGEASQFEHTFKLFGTLPGHSLPPTASPGEPRQPTHDEFVQAFPLFANAVDHFCSAVQTFGVENDDTSTTVRKSCPPMDISLIKALPDDELEVLLISLSCANFLIFGSIRQKWCMKVSPNNVIPRIARVMQCNLVFAMATEKITSDSQLTPERISRLTKQGEQSADAVKALGQFVEMSTRART